VNAFVVAAPHSGAGKTTITTGLLAALARRGHRVQAYKVGPDYIDPSYHRLATGRPSRTLDTWLCPPEVVRTLFWRWAADVNIVEGVMGLFDGGPGGRGSTAEVARLLDLPVVLVVDASRLAQSAGALIHGFATYDPGLRLVGVLFTRVASPSHAASLLSASPVPVLGWVEEDPSLLLPERHLGLVPTTEWRPDLSHLAEAVTRHVDLDRLLELTRRPAGPALPPPAPAPPRARIAYAWDEAFSFYYEDNLDLLRWSGAELVPVRMLDDRGLPEAGLLYLGGGFPEVYQEALLANRPMAESVRSFPGAVYAECGGLMYLAMLGVIPGRVAMTDRLQHFGYAEATALVDTLLLRAGETVRGHEFHYSLWEGPANAYRVRHGPHERVEGYASGRILATYVHVHLGARPDLATRLVEAARGWAP
jgi:cobyrinic acid a,c-diamide synthase